MTVLVCICYVAQHIQRKCYYIFNFVRSQRIMFMVTIIIANNIDDVTHWCPNHVDTEVMIKDACYGCVTEYKYSLQLQWFELQYPLKI